MNSHQHGDGRIIFHLGVAVDHVINVVLLAEFVNVL